MKNLIKSCSFALPISVITSLFCVSVPVYAAGAPIDLCAVYNTNVPTSKIETVQNGMWSDPATWGGAIPTAADDLIINHTVNLDQGVGREIQVHGHLEIEGTLDAHASILVCNDGLLSGDEGKINFRVANDRDFTGNTAPGPVQGAFGFHPQDNGLWVVGGGELNLTGPEVTSWLDAVSLNGSFSSYEYGVSRSAAFQNGVGKLAQSPQGWQVGDQLLLVSEQGDDALATLTSINGRNISYQAETNLTGYVLKVEESTIHPKIANLSRRLQIVSANVSEGDVNHRAHTVYLRGSTVSINNVEFRNLGPRGKLGRYPVHWHHAHDSTGSGLIGSSIWQSVDDGSNRFVVPHIVNGVTVADNVGFRAQGHGFFMEEVQEYNNVVSGNLSVDVRHGEELPNVHSSWSSVTHHFWLRESNENSGNVAAGNNWDGTGKGNKTIQIAGLIVLPSSIHEPTPVVDDFECLGCGGLGMWTTVPNTLFNNPSSAYALTTAAKSWTAGKINSSGMELVDPTFLLNGNNALFHETGNFRDKIPWVSQIYLNYGEMLVSGGILAGKFGVHAHYRAKFALDGTAVYGGTFVDSTYWELSTVSSNLELHTSYLFSRGYRVNHRNAPGIARLNNVCFGAECNNSTTPGTDVAITASRFAPLFNGAANFEVIPGVSNTSTLDNVPDSGFIRVPKELSAGYWSIVEASSNQTPVVRIRRARESSWEKGFQYYGGYPDGFAPGNYEIKLYDTSSTESFIAAGTATVTEGLVSNICLEGEICDFDGPPTLMIHTLNGLSFPSGASVYIEGYARDLTDGLLSDQISWSSSIDGALGQGAGFEASLSDGYHRITATITDSDGNQVDKDMSLKIGAISSSSRNSTSGNTSSAPTVADGVAILAATTSCEEGLNPHWQCRERWSFPADIDNDTFVAHCPETESTSGGCTSEDVWVKFGNLASTELIAVCAGAAPVNLGRLSCVSNGGRHIFVPISEVIDGSAETGDASGVLEPADESNEGSSGEPSEPVLETQDNSSTQNSSTAVLAATTSCEEGLNPHWQCRERWSFPADIDDDTFVAHCPETESTSGGCTSEDVWVKFGNLASTELIAVCAGAAPVNLGRLSCVSNGGRHIFVPISEVIDGSAETGDAGSVIEPADESNEVSNGESQNSETNDPVEEPTESNEEPAVSSDDSDIEPGGEETFDQEPIAGSEEDANEIIDAGSDSQGQGKAPEDIVSEEEPVDVDNTDITPEPIEEEQTDESVASGEGSEDVADDVGNSQDTSTGSGTPESTDDSEAPGANQQGETEEDETPDEESNDSESNVHNTEPVDSGNDTNSGSSVESETPKQNDTIDSGNEGSSTPSEDPVEDEANSDSETEESGSNESQIDTDSENQAESENAANSDENSAEPEDSVGDQWGTGNTEINNPAEEPQDSSSSAGNEVEESVDPVNEETESGDGDIADSEKPASGSGETEENTDSSDNIGQVEESTDASTTEEVQEAEIVHEILFTNGEGQLLFNSGTIFGVDNNGTIIGGVIDGYIDNTEGVMVNVHLTENALIERGLLVGELSGAGSVSGVLLDVDTIDPAVNIEIGSLITTDSVATIAGLDLTSIVTKGNGIVDPATKFLYEGANAVYSIVDLLEQFVNDYYENESTMISINEVNGAISISNDGFSGILDLLVESVTTSNLDDRAEIMNDGDIHITKDNLEIVFNDVTIY